MPPVKNRQAIDRVSPVVTVHAIERYRERVNAQTAVASVARVLCAIAGGGRRRSRPRRWMRGTRVEPGTMFVYSAEHPGVCLLVRDGVILTVYSRAACRAWRADDLGAAA